MAERHDTEPKSFGTPDEMRELRSGRADRRPTGKPDGRRQRDGRRLRKEG